MTANVKKRDYLFDNYKALLILLVVIGHFTEPCYENNTLLYTVKWFIFAFHMPAFILISGYFSRRQASLGKMVQRLLIPYLVFEVLYYLVYTLLIQKETGLYLLRPKFSLWYLLALFVWRLITPYVKRIPHYFLLSIAAGLAAGFLTIPSNFLSIPRILVFYPYFLAGTLFDRELLSRCRRVSLQALSALGVLAFTLYLIFDTNHKALDAKIFYGRYNYASLGQGAVDGVLVRLLCYGIGFFLTFAFALLLTERRTIYSRLGTMTMAIYLFHGLIYNFLKERTSLLAAVESIPASLALLAFCTALTLLLSWKPLTTFTTRVSSLSLTSLGAQAQRTLAYRGNPLNSSLIPSAY